jgi:hypothetical protein
MMNIKRFWRWRYIIPAAVVLGPIFLVAFAAFAGWIVMQLWNWLLPPLFGWREITMWQGAGLLVLCRILFGGWGGGGSGGHSKPMTPEEREHVRQRMRDHHCDAPPAPGSPVGGGG